MHHHAAAAHTPGSPLESPRHLSNGDGSGGSGADAHRFRLRLFLFTVNAKFGNLFTPVAAVLLTDARCLHDLVDPLPKVTTPVLIQYCSDRFNGECTYYDLTPVETTYAPEFAYDGERCSSAVLSLYGPVLLAVSLLASVVPAALEVLAVPLLAPPCHARSASSPWARRTLRLLQLLTKNVTPVLAAARVHAAVHHRRHRQQQQRRREESAAAEERSSSFSVGGSSPLLSSSLPSLPAVNAHELARSVVERGLSCLLATLLVAATFGVALPAVGCACVVGALVSAAHHRHVLHQVVDMAFRDAQGDAAAVAGSEEEEEEGEGGLGRGRSSSVGRAAQVGLEDVLLLDLAGCSATRWRCAAVIAASACAFWTGSSIGFLSFVGLGVGAVTAAAAAVGGGGLLLAHAAGKFHASSTDDAQESNRVDDDGRAASFLKSMVTEPLLW